MARSALENILACALAAAILAGCAARRGAPVVERAPEPKPSAAKPAQAAQPVARVPDTRPDFYTVRKGDTLYSIALDHGLDYRELALWNGIADPAVIRAGQQLRLKPPASVATPAPVRAAPAPVPRPLAEAAPGGGDTVKTEPKAVRVPYSEQAYAQLAALKPDAQAPKAEAPRPVAEAVEFVWPAKGTVITAFSEPRVKGIDIGGRLGDPVVAAAPGKVIYVGTGIPGLGKFVIIKHSEEFSTVYAHTREVHVKRDEMVARGQRIAEIGDTDAERPKLHFQIRRFGKPLDPLKLLPPA
jgi:lipoprotein NlpD